MIKIAICDDQIAGQKSLHNLVRNSKVFENAEYTFFEDGNSLVNTYNSGSKYDFVFLDVDMPVVNGIEAGIQINKIDPRTIIIFYSAYPQFAVDAFDCNAFHYIVKGIDNEKFTRILKRAYDKYRRLNELFVVKLKDGVISIPVTEIYYVEYMKKHLVIHTENGEFDTRDSMTNACEKLCSLGFCLCHQSFLVNFEKVYRIMKSDVVLVNGEKVMLSVRKRADVIASYNRYIESYVL